MDIIECLEWRYATKKFDETKYIDPTTIDRICTAFNLTATSYGLQPIKLLVVKNKELQAKMQGVAMNQAQVSTASHVFVFCVETSVDTDFIANYFENIKNTREDGHAEIDAYHKVLAERFADKSNEDIKLWATKQAYLALGNLLTVCAIEKVDSCPMEGFLPQKLDELLNLEKQNLSSVLLLPVGIRDKNDLSANETKVRRSINDIVEIIL